MILTNNVKDVKFVMSKDELGYQEVVDDFPNANKINILTFNISKNSNVLINALKKCSPDTEINFVSNIPQRWDDYFGTANAQKAREGIRLYKSKLDPEKIAAKAEVYFCKSRSVFLFFKSFQNNYDG